MHRDRVDIRAASARRYVRVGAARERVGSPAAEAQCARRGRVRNEEAKHAEHLVRARVGVGVGVRVRVPGGFGLGAGAGLGLGLGAGLGAGLGSGLGAAFGLG